MITLTNMTIRRQLPSPEALRQSIPLSAAGQLAKARRDQEIAEILSGKSSRMLLIIGPCSADNETAVCDYVGRLARVQEKVSDRLVLVPRIYTTKPRTNGDGYKGIAIQPDPERRMQLILQARSKVHESVLRKQIRMREEEKE